MTEPRSLEERVLQLEQLLATTVTELHGMKLGSALWMLERLPHVPPMAVLEPIMRGRLLFEVSIDALRSAGGPWEPFAKTLESYDQQIVQIRIQLQDAWARPGSTVKH